MPRWYSLIVKRKEEEGGLTHGGEEGMPVGNASSSSYNFFEHRGGERGEFTERRGGKERRGPVRKECSVDPHLENLPERKEEG